MGTRISDERLRQIRAKKRQIEKQNAGLQELKDDLAEALVIMEGVSPEDAATMSRTAMFTRTSRGKNDDVLDVSESAEQDKEIIKNIEKAIAEKEVELVELEKEKKVLETAYP